MDAAFVAGMEAMASYSTGAEGTQQNDKGTVIAAGAAAFAAIAGPAITTYIQSATVVPGIPVATAGSPSAQVGATTGPGVIL
jgi:hypothetical protein